VDGDFILRGGGSDGELLLWSGTYCEYHKNNGRPRFLLVVTTGGVEERPTNTTRLSAEEIVRPIRSS